MDELRSYNNSVSVKKLIIIGVLEYLTFLFVLSIMQIPLYILGETQAYSIDYTTIIDALVFFLMFPIFSVIFYKIIKVSRSIEGHIVNVFLFSLAFLFVQKAPIPPLSYLVSVIVGCVVYIYWRILIQKV
ncbi:MAG: hypothetical protein ACP6IU_13795 [Candidatus Asgardarchaeia archaeon]